MPPVGELIWYAKEQQGMDSWKKNAGWLFGTLEEHIQKRAWDEEAKNRPDSKDSHLGRKWDQIKGPNWVTTQSWLGAANVHDELSKIKTQTKRISDVAPMVHFVCQFSVSFSSKELRVCDYRKISQWKWSLSLPWKTVQGNDEEDSCL